MDKTQHAQGTILDHNGVQVKKKDLTKEVATATLAGVRNAWHNQTVAAGLAPDTLATLLQNAANNDAEAYLILAEEMEEKDLHYQSVLGTRKRAISGLDTVIESASDSAQDVKLADAVRAIVRLPAYGMMIDEAVDALGKGYSVNEIVWQRSANSWTPVEYHYRDPRFFKFDEVTGRELRLIDEANSFEGVALAPFKFIIHIPRLKSGLPIRGGLARLVAVAYMCKAYTLTDWLAFAETFGMPLRVGKHGPSASNEEIRTLINAVANIGTDAAAVIPENMRIEFESAGTTSGGDKLFQNLAEWLDQQVSKAVLGQTMTSDSGSSQAQAKVHNEVRLDILKADAKQLEHTLNKYLVKPFIDLNFGQQQTYPKLTLPVVEPEDLEVLASVLEKLIPFGLRVEESQVRDKLGFRDPAKDATVLQVQPTNTHLDTAKNSEASCDYCQHKTALNTVRNPDPLDELEQEAMEDWQEQMTPIIDPLQKLAEEAQDFDEFLARLPELYNEMDTTEVVKQLALQTFKARGIGDTDNA